MHWIDPESLPEVAGTVERFILNSHGEVDGFVMQDYKHAPILVHTPPHLEDELTRHVKIGGKVGVRGVRPRSAKLIAAVAVSAENGAQIIDKGPPHDRKSRKPDHRKMKVEGIVRLSLFGPKGDLRGALLTDGDILCIGPKEAERIAVLLAPGARVAASGDGVETGHGRVIAVGAIGIAMDELRPVERPKPKHPKHDHAAHG
ncbi:MULTISPECIES: hypothetical protein [unclassified Bradyrhizobium]|jgi:hypothetical protein|uniref:hypothetical protein n=1 Tax=unclassified Bradyrhizobium TaxID=2631580 RepID=UPI00339AEE59